ncbi:MAG: hypothetical protein R2684_04875 [Pyrinomonadaceae bacterium]
MKTRKLAIIVSFVFLFAVSAFAQSDFSDPSVDYTFSLPDDDWKLSSKPSDVSPNVEYIYKFKNDGFLQVRKIKVEETTLYSEMISQEEQGLQIIPGYVPGKDENFRGSLSGRVFNYEFVKNGRNMSGRIYFLKADSTTVYVLRFTGEKDKLRSIRNQTDSIARSFKIKGEE